MLVEDEQTVFKRADNVEEIAFGKRFALYRSGTERVVILNKTGSLLWKQLQSRQSTPALIEHLQTQFPKVSKEQLESDVRAFLHELSSSCFVEAVAIDE